MNTNHYPSLELCKKLTEIGFPETDKEWFEHYTDGALRWNIYDNGGGDGVDMKFRPVCPSVMEMLDVMPNWITVNYKDGDIGNYKLEIGRQGKSDSTDAYYVHYVEGNGAYSFMLGTLPNSLAEMTIWLHENNYIKF